MARKQADSTAGAADLEAARWFFEHSLDVFIVTRDAVIVSVNPAWSSLTGWRAEDAIGKKLSVFGHEDDRETIAKVRRELDEIGDSLAEHRVKRIDGEWLWMRSRARKDAVTGETLIILQDITSARIRDEELRELSHSTSLLRESAGIYVWRYNPETRSYIFNHDVQRDEEPSEDDRSIRSRIDVASEIHPDDTAAMDRAFKHTLNTGEFNVIEYRNKRADGTWGALRAAWRGMRKLPGGKWEVLGTTQDITELAAARDAAIQGERAAQEAAETKSQFLANMSHEIRTPMNGVLGVLHLLKHEPLSQDGRRMIQEALACGSMLSELLNDVIDFSKIEAGRLELTPEPVNPVEALEGVAGMMRPQAQAKGLYLEVSADPRIAWVRIDPVRLRQMLFNLIGNAVKFTLKGGVHARMTVAGRPGSRRLRVEIEDTGVGIDEAAHPTLFQRFSQADGSTTRQFGGSGLGLSIVRALSDLMEGDVGFVSTPGAGSTFWFEIAAPECQAPADSACEDETWLAGLRALVVEDNATNRLIATKMLENLGASVETAENGALGVDAVKARAFDLVFMDVQMPVMDGVTATRAIRALPGALGQIPIIAMTANALAHQIESYRAAGMNGSVSKPLSPAALLAELSRLVSEAPEAEAAA